MPPLARTTFETAVPRRSTSTAAKVTEADVRKLNLCMKLIYGQADAFAKFVFRPIYQALRVRRDGRHLVVSNSFEASASRSAPLQTSGKSLPESPTSYNIFRVATELGDRATFIPEGCFDIRFWRTDQIVGELRQLAGSRPDA